MYYNLQHITLDLKLLKIRLKLFNTKRVRILKMALKSNRIICLSSLSYNFVILIIIHHIHYLFYLEVNLLSKSKNNFEQFCFLALQFISSVFGLRPRNKRQWTIFVLFVTFRLARMNFIILGKLNKPYNYTLFVL